VPVEVYDHVLDSLTLEVVEEGWSLTDGDARLVVSGDDGTGMIAGAVRVQGDGRLRFTPGRLTREVPDAPPAGGDEPGEEAGELVARRGRNLAADAGQRRETFRVDLMLDVVVLDDGRELPAQTLNLSPTGCLLRGAARPLVDTIVVVRIPVDDRQLALRAQVIRVDGERYALHFREMDAAQERQLSGLLAKRQREILRRR
jgi:hypothetical protein